MRLMAGCLHVIVYGEPNASYIPQIRVVQKLRSRKIRLYVKM